MVTSVPTSAPAPRRARPPTPAARRARSTATATRYGCHAGSSARIARDRRPRRRHPVRREAERQARERMRPGEHLARHHGQRPQVPRGAGRVAAQLLRRHVVRRAEHDAGVRLAGAARLADRRHLGDAEIQDLRRLHSAVAGEEHVLGLQVAVHEAHAVRRLHRAAHAAHDGEHPGGIEPAGAREFLAQRASPAAAPSPGTRAIPG